MYCTLAISNVLSMTAQTSAYKIADWEDFKTAAVTYTFDDCLINQYNTVVPLFNKYGYKGSFYIVSNWANNPGNTHYTWANAKTMYAAGHEIGSHTVSHADLNNASTYEAEMKNSKSAVESNVGNTCKTIVYPDCVTPSSESVCAKYYIGGRICNGQVEGKTPNDFYQIGCLICGNQGNYNSTSSITGAFQTAKNKGGWCVLLIHEINNGSGYSPLSSTVVDETLQYLKNNDSYYWVTTFGNAICYIKERNAASLTEVSNTNSKITMTVTDNLDNSLYNYPLSLRRTLPSGWTDVTVTQNGKEVESSISNGYIYFKAVPDGGTVTLAPTTTEVLPTASITNPSAAVTWKADSTYSINWKMSGASSSDNILYWNYAGSGDITPTSASASSEWSNDDKSFTWSASNVLTNDTTGRWAAASSPYAGQWVMLTLSGTSTISGVQIDEYARFGTISGFEIQYDNGDNNWKTAYTGTTIGSNFSCSFSPVSASRVRLYITEASNVNINYFGLIAASKTALYSTIGADGSYQWTIPASYAGTTGTLSITTASGSLLAESKTITITKTENGGSNTGGNTGGNTNVTIDGGYTGPSCDGEGSGAYHTGIYRNLFSEILGKTDTEVQNKIDAIWKQFFTPGGTNAVYYNVGDTMAYIYDTGNQDVRTEGMSYGMMICVQLNHQDEFNKIWRWAKKYMQYQSGDWDGYFKWQCATDGTVKGSSCASDGEEYFITALLFASNRWGNTGDIDYNAEAQNILSKVQEKSGTGNVYSLFNKSNHLVTFVPYGNSADYSDPSYNLPGFLELWARWSDTNNDFWYAAAKAARTLLKNASNTTSGLFPDYCSFAGEPLKGEYADYDTKQYKYDAIRCAMNVGMDYNWFRSDSTNQNQMMTRLLTFFKNNNYTNGYFDWNGSNPSGSYSEGIAGANGVGCFAVSDQALAKENLTKLWNMNAPTGQWRYYNGMVYFLSMLHASGNFKIYKPTPAMVDTTITGKGSVTFNGVKYTENTKFTTYYNCKIYNVTININNTGVELVSSNSSLGLNPNPTNCYFEVNANGKVKNVTIFDLIGNKVLSQTGSSHINCGHLPKGIYIVKVEIEGQGTQTTKLCIK